MRDSPTAAGSGECPDSDDSFHHDDPEIAALLRFDPVFRKVKRPDGWTPELQREFIALLAECGSPRRAAEAMGKKVSGVEALYREADAETFRASWDAAMAIGKARTSAPRGARFDGRAPGCGGAGGGRGWRGPDAEPEEEVSEEQKLELLERIASKILRKVAQERQARVGGEIVAADFYLRQITMIEVCFELLTSELGFNASDYLRSLRRGEHGLLDIVDTEWVQFLDEKRREYWLSDPSEPPRPILFRQEFLEDHGDYRTQPSHSGLGGCTVPARGYDAEQWKVMTTEQQRAARERQFEEDAAEQMVYERRAYEDWVARVSTERSDAGA